MLIFFQKEFNTLGRVLSVEMHSRTREEVRLTLTGNGQRSSLGVYCIIGLKFHICVKAALTHWSLIRP